MAEYLEEMRSGAAPVVVTGASGFIGLHLVLRLLQEGCRVRGTLRNMQREGQLREALSKGAPIPPSLKPWRRI